MSSASSARQIGDEAQQYLFWLWGIRMLAGRGVSEVGYETGHFRVFDDVAVRFTSPRPNGFGGFFDEDHVQAKFSVTGGKVLTGESLADPTLINATDVSLLERLRDAVDQAEQEGRRCRFCLWSPWPVEPGSLLAQMVDTCQGALRLNLLFEGKTIHSKSGQLRKCWADILGLKMDDESELRRILSPLRIDYDPRTLDRIRSDVSDVLPTAGLRPIQNCCRADCYPVLIQRLHREGRRWFSPNDLIEACKHDGLWVGRPEITMPVTKLGIRTFTRFAEGLEDDTDEMICLTEFFTGRHIREPRLWEEEVLPRLLKFLSQRLVSGGHYRLHLPAVASVAFTSGYLAEPKLGASFEVSQGGISGTKIWLCGSADGEGDVAWSEDVADLGRKGDELAVAISATHPVVEDVKIFASQRLPAIGKVLHLALSAVGQDSVKSGGHAFRAAQQAVTAILRRHEIRSKFRLGRHISHKDGESN